MTLSSSWYVIGRLTIPIWQVSQCFLVSKTPFVLGRFFSFRTFSLASLLLHSTSPPSQLTFDLDPFDDPTHGQQQLTSCHGYYDQYQYLPRVITCAEKDRVVMTCLLYGRAHAALGVQDDVTYLVTRLRDVWPGVKITFRGDCGLGAPHVYEAC